MKKDTFKMSIIVLLIGGFIVKIQSFIIKILFTRAIGEEALALYTIAVPTYSLMVALATFALPLSISKLISEERFSEKRILTTSFFFALLLEGILIFTFYHFSDFIAQIFLKQKEVIPIIKAMALTLPFISFSSIFKGYFLGKFKVLPNTLSNMIEQSIRILFLIFFLPKLVMHNALAGLICFILISILTESVSCFIFFLFLPKKIHIEKKDFIPQRKILSSLLETSIPCVSSRLIGNIGFFLEPIILTNLLLLNGYSNH
ncbi:MAG: oligosaccharide flippase family protein [Bacilli bacterium]|nr:oligosaccharide flippase family protein [Bacilli bacterium]